MAEYRKSTTIEKRLEESTKIRNKYKDRTPVIVLTQPQLKLDKFKYLVPSNMSVSEFMVVLRRRVTLNSDEALFILTDDDTMPRGIDLISKLDQTNIDKDGFLYLKLFQENTFGV